VVGADVLGEDVAVTVDVVSIPSTVDSVAVVVHAARTRQGTSTGMSFLMTLPFQKLVPPKVRSGRFT
jgi:hypothetical protein